MAKSKRVLVISDLHCGHLVGLTPPGWQLKSNSESKHIAKYGKIQNVLWNKYRKMVQSLKPIDILIVNGDAIDGKGKKSGSTEQITSDRNEQANMAVRCIQEVAAPKIYLTYGTGYHTGDDEDFEDGIVKSVKKMGTTKECCIKDHPTINVNGLIFDCKHHVGGSQIPHGRFTAAARERLWNVMWAEKKQRPKADVIIRSHVHYFAAAVMSNFLAMTTPSLQGLGTKYGARRVSGTVDFGVVHFDVKSKEDYQWGWIIPAYVDAERVQVLKP